MSITTAISLVVALFILSSGPLSANEAHLAEDLYQQALDQRIESIEGLDNRQHVVQLIMRAAKLGHVDAQSDLGLRYITGEGVEENPTESAYWIRKSADQGKIFSQSMLAYFYDNGYGVPLNEAEAAVWYRMAASQGDDGAQYILAQRYRTGHGVLPDPVEALRWYRKAADQGHTDAQSDLSSFYQNGEMVEKDSELALFWRKKAALSGDGEDAMLLGYSYKEGEYGIKRDAEQAVYWLSIAAEKGQSIAQYLLANMYRIGEGVEKDLSKAFIWTKASAEQGASNAQYNLSMMYGKGEGTEVSKSDEKLWMRRAADQGLAAAQTTVGFSYLHFEEKFHTDANRQAEKWFLLAAKQGDAKAQLLLGHIYSNDYAGVQSDYTKSVYWATKSADQNYPQASKLLANLTQYRVSSWRPDSYQTFTFAEHHGRSYQVEIAFSKGNEKRLYFRVDSLGVFSSGNVCDNPSADALDTTLWNFNGQAVSMLTSCHFTGAGDQETYLSATPKTSKGMRFVSNLFRRSSSDIIVSVNGRDIPFSATGFTAAWNSMSAEVL